MSAPRMPASAQVGAALRDCLRRLEEGTVERRVFLVGCPRSGTTLLQSLLHAHREVRSLPETHVVPRLLGSEEHRRGREDRDDGIRARWNRRRRRWLADAGLVDPRRAGKAWRSLRELGLDAPPPARLDCRLDSHLAAFARALDRHALQAQRSAWVEKTPDHLFYVERLQAALPGARFIHLQRDGHQVAASLYQAACRYRQWQPFLDLARGVERWAVAMAESARWRRDPRHLHVRYEDLVEAPGPTLAGVLGFIGCDEDPGLWSRYRGLAGGLIREDEPWKQGNLQPLQRRDAFAALDPAQRRQVEAALAAHVSATACPVLPARGACVSPPAQAGIALANR